MATTVNISDIIADVESVSAERIAAIQADLATTGGNYQPIKVIAEGSQYRLLDGRDHALVLALADDSETTVQARVFTSRARALAGLES